VEEEANDWIRVFYPRQTCFIYKYALMGLYKGQVQNIFTGSYILPSADDKRKINVSREKVREKRERRSYLSRSTSYLVLDSGA
jgi:hypothetical protein